MQKRPDGRVRKETFQMDHRCHRYGAESGAVCVNLTAMKSRDGPENS